MTGCDEQNEFQTQQSYSGNILCVTELRETNKATNESAPKSLVDFQKSEAGKGMGGRLLDMH